MGKLIIVRGPSGVGKSTVSKIIRDRSDRPTLLIEQDYFRLNFNQVAHASQIPVWELVEATTKIGLEHGFDVILEGILNVIKLGRKEAFERLFAVHLEENYVFYLEASFDETARRHVSRPEKAAQFGPEDMKEWYGMASPMEHARETIIPESSTLEETIKTIAKIAGLNLSKPE